MMNKKTKKKPKSKKQVEYPKKASKGKSKYNLIKEEKSREYDLEERTAKFGEDIIEFVKKVS